MVAQLSAKTTKAIGKASCASLSQSFSAIAGKFGMAS
jgi:hypothetical protein